MRDTPFGQIVRHLTRNRWLQYPEEKPGFTLPPSYEKPGARVAAANEAEKDAATAEVFPEKNSTNIKRSSNDNSASNEAVEPAEDVEKAMPADVSDAAQKTLDLERAETATSQTTTASGFRMRKTRTQREGFERVVSRTTLSNSVTQADLQREYTIASLAKGPSEPIRPTTLEDGTTLVDFYDTDDPENPQNYSSKKKIFIAAQIWYVHENDLYQSLNRHYQLSCTD